MAQLLIVTRYTIHSMLRCFIIIVIYMFSWLAVGWNSFSKVIKNVDTVWVLPVERLWWREMCSSDLSLHSYRTGACTERELTDWSNQSSRCCCCQISYAIKTQLKALRGISCLSLCLYGITASIIEAWSQPIRAQPQLPSTNESGLVCLFIWICLRSDL